MKLVMWPYYFVELIVVVLWEVLLSNIRLAHQMAKPLARLTPGVLQVPLSITSATQMTVLANLVTLTPGTLSLDIDAERRILTIHTIDASNPAKIRSDIKEILEKRIARIFP